ncbi:DUF4982 domain-containing protein [Mucilaginibacter gilvus]|uniref:DUF4982 domain-containing protein n=1 Tax=Mucilaginibacter gilvus TaxID=2305909 RepID=A0A3S3W7D1_9SPHI|nr:DUF4982 domain-containing protein [Mucilaginibacter gilvus]RWY50108.1 DUF4982 domain-containing protein [Mucilaginibacter gilvus]
MVYIGAREITSAEDKGIWSHRNALPIWNWQAGSKIKIDCYTNCQEVELFLNGRSLGKQARNATAGHMPSWQVDYEPGELVVKAFNNGIEVCRNVIKTAGEASQLKALPDNALFAAKTKGLSQVEIAINDNKGNPVFKADNEITVSVTGPGKLIGLESGSTTSHEDYKGAQSKALNGRLLAYIQTNGTAGKIQVLVSSPGLKPASIILIVKQPNSIQL